MKSLSAFAVAVAALTAADSALAQNYPDTGYGLLPLPAATAASPVANSGIASLPQQARPAAANPAYAAAPAAYSPPPGPGAMSDMYRTHFNPRVASMDDPVAPGDLSSDPYADALSGSYDGCCGGEACCAPVCCGPVWFGGLSGLYLTRDNPNPIWLTFEDGVLNSAILSSRDADIDWGGGYEVSFGRYFGDRYGIQATFWQLEHLVDTAYGSAPGNTVSTPLDLSNVTIGGAGASTFFDSSPMHRIHRRNEFYNVELNLLSMGAGMRDPCANCGVQWIAGFRFFKFDEDLIFSAVQAGNGFGANGGANEADMDWEMKNNLIGFQIGAMGEYRLGPRLSFYATPKIGIYGNDIHQNFQLRRGDGVSGVVTGGEVLNISSNKTDVAILGQLDLGARWQIVPCCSVFGGYRVVAASGVALADEQIPFFLADTGGIRNIDSNGSLLLHGAQLGLLFEF